MLEAIPDTTNLYIFTDPKNDRDRIIAQCFLYAEYLRGHAKQVITEPKRILDLGCGEGQLTLALSQVFPDAQIIGVDRDARAIDLAKAAVAALPVKSRKIEFVVGDIQEKLPDGPFDLIYTSMVMMHLAKPKEVIEKILPALSPGGTVWMKELRPDWTTVIDHPAWLRLGELLMDTMDKIGSHIRISVELERLLKEAGFVDTRVDMEQYVMANDSLRGKIALAVGLGVYMNTRKMVAKVQNIPEEDVLRLNTELLKVTDRLHGTVSYLNVIGHRPLTAQSKT